MLDTFEASKQTSKGQTTSHESDGIVYVASIPRICSPFEPKPKRRFGINVWIFCITSVASVKPFSFSNSFFVDCLDIEVQSENKATPFSKHNRMPKTVYRILHEDRMA